MDREKPLLTNEVKAFVDANKIELDKSGLRCGDGRNTPEQSRGNIRIFGEDFGPMLAVAATLKDHGQYGSGFENSLNSEKIVSAYLGSIKQVNGVDAKMHLHTDVHGEEKGAIGCGHANRASSEDAKYNGEGKYGVTFGEARDLFEKTWNNTETEHLTLSGDHCEKAVLLVYGKDGNAKYSVNSTDGKVQYFVVDMDAIKEYFEKIIPVVAEKLGTDLKTEDVLGNYLKQQGISAGLLAGHLPKFNVTIDSEGKAVVEQAS